MAQYDFGTDPTELRFNVKHDDDDTKVRVDGSDYAGGYVQFDASLGQNVQLKIGNGSPTKWDIKALSVKFNGASVEMKLDSDGFWKGELDKNQLSGAAAASLNVIATWEARDTGQKEPKEDPVIIVNPTPTPRA